MNKYDELYNFRLATMKDVDAIMDYIRREWKSDHILALNRDFFIWMYGNECYCDTDTVNFVLMEDKNGNIKGINGFIPYSEDKSRLDVSSAITKVSPDVAIPMAGIEIIKRFHDIVGARRYYSYGTNPKTMAPIGKRVFGFDVGFMSQYYMLNPKADHYEIADIRHKKYTEIPDDQYSLCKVNSINEIREHFSAADYNQQGYKSEAYIKHRYFEHPVYSYEIYYLKKQDEIISDFVLVGRTMIVGTKTSFRIMDILGDVQKFRMCGSALLEFMITNDHEYIDLLCSGMDESLIFEAGFILRDQNDENIIPHYFEPFEKKNIDIWYQKSDSEVIIFKADGDQDRPNRIN